ncbi:hypothetical protein ACXZ66_04090 [Corynebacterium sp. S7]
MSDNGVAHPEHVRQGAMEEFLAVWREHSSPSAASAVVAKNWGVGRTTLSEWLQAEGKWPYTRVAANLRLAEENERLRRELDELKGHGA